MKKKETTKKQTTYDIDEYRKRQKWKKRKTALLSALTLVLLTVLVIGGLYLYRNYDIDQLLTIWSHKSEDGTIVQEEFPISVDGIFPKQILSAKKTVLLRTKDEAAVVSTEGKVLHNFTHRFTNAVIKASDNRLLTYDKGGFNYRIDSSTNRLFEGKLARNILTGEISDDGSYAFVTGETNYAGSVTVFGKNNEEILKWYSASDQIIDFDFSPDGEQLAVACVGFEQGILLAKVYLLSIYGGDEVEKASLSFSNSLPVDLSYTESGTIHLVCDDCAVVISGDLSKAEQSFFDSGLVHCYHSRYRTIAVLESVNQASYTVLLLTEGGESFKAKFSGNIFAITDSLEKVYLLSKNNIYVFDEKLSKTDEIPLADDVFDIAAVKEGLYSLDPLKLDKIF